jgi:hypothetical protein
MQQIDLLTVKTIVREEGHMKILALSLWVLFSVMPAFAHPGGERNGGFGHDRGMVSAMKGTTEIACTLHHLSNPRSPRIAMTRDLWLGKQHHRAKSVSAELLYEGKSAPYG